MSPDSAFSSLSGADIAAIRTALHFSYTQFAIALRHHDPLFDYHGPALWKWERGIRHVPIRASRVIASYAAKRGLVCSIADTLS